jgi:mono/diheme cytochrome c family protein
MKARISCNASAPGLKIRRNSNVFFIGYLIGGFMRFAALSVCFLALMVALWAFAAPAGDVAKGKALFNRCSICHGESGEGKDSIAKAFGVRMLALGSQEVQALDDAAIKKIILSGKGKMQPVSLSNEEAQDVVAFIRSLKKPAAKP